VTREDPTSHLQPQSADGHLVWRDDRPGTNLCAVSARSAVMR
jgi:hypothetical protein